MTQILERIQHYARAFVVGFFIFHFLVGLTFMYHNWKAILVTPFQGEINVTVQAEELSPVVEE